MSQGWFPLIAIPELDRMSRITFLNLFASIAAPCEMSNILHDITFRKIFKALYWTALMFI